MEQIGIISKKILSQPIYRIDTLERFYEILNTNILTFVRPSEWKDPMENILFNASVTLNGKEFIHPGKVNIYGYCWSYEKDSYALWQIYRKDCIGVRMTTHFQNLKQIAFQNSLPLFYGKVKYFKKYQLMNLVKDRNFISPLKNLQIGEDHLKTLLIKRSSYQYEKEIRLFCISDSVKIDPENNNLLRLKINPKSFFSSVRFDPAMEFKEFTERKRELVRKHGFRPTQISRSTLMLENKLKIKL